MRDFGLTAKAEEDEVVFGEDGVDDLGDDGVFVADDAGEEWGLRLRGGAQLCDQVVAELVLDGAGENGQGCIRWSGERRG